MRSRDGMGEPVELRVGGHRLGHGLMALMRRLDIHALSDLPQHCPRRLAAQLRYVNAREGYLRRTPRAQELAAWITAAR